VIPLLLAYTAIGSAFDLSERRVPNGLTLAALLALGLVIGSELGPEPLGAFVANVAIRMGFGLLAFAVLYCCEVGTGDVKAGLLFGAALSWWAIPWLLIVVAVLAAVLYVQGARHVEWPFFPLLGGVACAVAGGVWWWGA
jgi:Flp pilus assembly protein protease CpaA